MIFIRSAGVGRQPVRFVAVAPEHGRARTAAGHTDEQRAWG